MSPSCLSHRRSSNFWMSSECAFLYNSSTWRDYRRFDFRPTIRRNYCHHISTTHHTDCCSYSDHCSWDTDPSPHNTTNLVANQRFRICDNRDDLDSNPTWKATRWRCLCPNNRCNYQCHNIRRRTDTECSTSGRHTRRLLFRT